MSFTGLDDDIWCSPDDPLPTAEPAPPQKSSERNTVEWIFVAGGAVVLAVLIRTFVFQTFWIPSPSMADTLVENDRVIVNKLSYRLHDVHRGDVVVFNRPPNEPDDEIKDLIKRVIGLAGERVSIRDGRVLINNQPLTEPYVQDLTTDRGCSDGDLAKLFTPEGLLIPDGHVFVLGDNRMDSADGRCFGPISEDLIVGRAFYKIWPPSDFGSL